jgi:exodeoxyribonuclease VII small subunit
VTARSGAADSPDAPPGQARRRATADGPVPGDRPARGDGLATDEATAGQPAAGGPAASRAAPAASRAAAPAASRAAPGQAPRLPYEKARDELTELVKRLEAGGLTLEQSLELWERGERLADICAEWLDGARARLATAMARREDGSADPAAPF